MSVKNDLLVAEQPMIMVVWKSLKLRIYNEGAMLPEETASALQAFGFTPLNIELEEIYGSIPNDVI
ncbi:hypothetical protein AXW67_35475 [Bradyrhizobium neotropicale]|uniref:Uncharacterized protein n=1 Tax=Bradyrhizobium neotropicale TaxID=1497615 RepID=A0A176ZJ96_9BRAD|nr:hypothetical protein AXW67_35475 [Bradyrhizobium neotropicale]